MVICKTNFPKGWDVCACVLYRIYKVAVTWAVFTYGLVATI